MKLQDLDLGNKKVLIRVDFNVPLKPDGSVADDTRIRESLPSISYALSQGASVILMSHLGRPKGKDAKLSLAPCAKVLSSLIQRPVLMAPDCIGPAVQSMVQSLKPGDLLLLENLRFYPAEENPSSDPTFAQQLAQLADFYVNDAFGTAHRAHSSTAIITQYFPGKCAAGMLLEKEIAFLGSLVTHPKRPFFAIIGGAKISSKLGVLHSLVGKVDGIFIGGAMAYTFFKAQGIEIGNSLFEPDQLTNAQEFLSQCKQKKLPVWLPKDLVIAQEVKEGFPIEIIEASQGIPKGWQGVDIGPKTREEWALALRPAATVFWNGPVGVFECPSFAKGTQAIAIALSELHAITVIGGGDSVAAIQQMGLGKKFSHLSTGGGASLEYLEYGTLPGIKALNLN